MESQYSPLLQQKIIDAQAAPLPALTRRDVWLPAVAGDLPVVWPLHPRTHTILAQDPGLGRAPDRAHGLPGHGAA